LANPFSERCVFVQGLGRSSRIESNADGNKLAVAFDERVSKALPRLPLFNRPLSDAPLLISIERISAELGYDLI
jgi:hypothetical protein